MSTWLHSGHICTLYSFVQYNMCVCVCAMYAEYTCMCIQCSTLPSLVCLLHYLPFTPYLIPKQACVKTLHVHSAYMYMYLAHKHA